ncbi:hypothetical protein BC777_0980 [Yoonia maricola]|uniref:Uncharacterized protein n=1 Tax=Yoonia maricola TaxID=420999 RepID=A0A2M8WMN2_9RHOB|nr:SRPBCC family protein [Yoonia maricola]PJI92136.1 hypothetical protein BC777_0980 [Yoonia maricola]
MPYTITVDATYGADADRVFEDALDFSEMQEAMKGLAVYEGLPDRAVQQGDTIYVDVTMFKILKTRDHCMHVERLDRDARIVQSREHNKAIKRWDHTLSVQPVDGGCLWRDRIVLDAGPTTCLTARFCQFVYARRHRLRKARSIQKSIVRGEVTP